MKKVNRNTTINPSASIQEVAFGRKIIDEIAATITTGAVNFQSWENVANKINNKLEINKRAQMTTIRINESLFKEKRMSYEVKNGSSL